MKRCWVVLGLSVITLLGTDVEAWEFSILPLELKQEILLNSSLEDLDQLSKSTQDLRDLILSDSFRRTYSRFSSPETAEQVRVSYLRRIVHLPLLQTLNELGAFPQRFASNSTKPNPPIPTEKLKDTEWRRAQVKALLEPETQFSEIPHGLFRIGSTSDPQGPNFDPERDQGNEALLDILALMTGVTYETSDKSNEKPTWVYLGKNKIQIRIERTSITQLLWFLVMGTNPSYFNRPHDCEKDHTVIDGIHLCPRNPVEQVSWDQIARKDRSGRYQLGTFLRTLKDQFGIEARLPTEAERERAARGAATQAEMLDLSSSFYRPYYFGFAGQKKENLAAHVWWAYNSGDPAIDIKEHLHRNSHSIPSSFESMFTKLAQHAVHENTLLESNFGNRTHRVGGKGWNSLGLADMSGNVYEWVSDWYDESYPEATQDHPLINPIGPETGNFRVSRGGSFLTRNRRFLRSAQRKYGTPSDTTLCNVGFRLVIEVPLP
jgi:formylglycine-generating enzyme required for sulfatase activity